MDEKSDLLRLIEIIQRYESLVEELLKFNSNSETNFKKTVNNYKKYLIKNAIDQNDGNINAALKSLGISRKMYDWLWKKS